MKTASLGYFAVLNFLLFARVPLDLFPSAWEDAAMHYSPAFHLSSFMLLAVLLLAAGWPVPRATLLALMVAYSLGTELIQGLLPYRSCELSDCLNDLAGIAAGAAVLWPSRLPAIAPWAGARGA